MEKGFLNLDNWLKKLNTYFSAFIFSLMCTGCIMSPKSTKDIIYPVVIPNISNSYIAGAFAGLIENDVFEIVNVESQEKYLLSFADNLFSLGVPRKPLQVRVIEVPPGKYYINGWGKDHGFGVSAIPGRGEKQQFQVKSGRVFFLGRYDVDQRQVGMRVEFRVSPEAMKIEDFLSLFKMQYPNFTKFGIDY